MANTIKIKNSSNTGAVPSTLEHGEIAINYADGKIFYKNNSNVIVQLSTSSTASLDDLSDVVISTPEEFQSVTYNGTSWVNSYAPTVTYVRNAESNTLTTGTAVYLFGSTGDHASVKRADNSSDTTSSKTIGLVAAPITSNNNGPIVTRGYVDGINLIDYTPGDVLWLGTNGNFTKTKPTAPSHLVFIGVVVRATNNGIVYVATQNGYELDELHDVAINNKTTGDFLKYNGTLWVNGPITLGTDTSGNYVSSLVAGNGISLSNNSGEGATPTVTNNGVLSINGSTGAITGVVTTADTGTVTSTMILDGTIMNADINASAAIDKTKISGTAITAADTGTVTSAMIADGTIVNDDVNSFAAISLSKLASGAAAQAIIANANGVPTYTTLSGDITIDSFGVVAIASNAVALGADTTGNYVASLVAGDGISLSNNSGEGATPSIMNSGVLSINGSTGAITGVVRTSDTGTVTSTMIADGTIVNADINASAAIAHSKLANATAGQVLLGTTTTGVVTATTISGDISIDGAGSVAIAANSIVNADINGSAAISLSKLASGSSAQIVLANATGVPTYTTVSGDFSINSSGVATLNANISQQITDLYVMSYMEVF